jgi:hypothetical protein
VDKRAELVAVAEALTAGGVPAAIDPRDVTPPAAYVHLGPWTYDLLTDQCLSAQVIVDIVATDAGTYTALGELDALETDVVTLLGPPVGQVLATTVSLPDSTAALPCYRLTYDVVMSATATA